MKALRYITLYFLIAVISGAGEAFSQSTGINNPSPNSNAALDIVASGNQGLLIPRITTAQRTAITGVPTGLICYSTSDNFIWYYDGTQWTSLLTSNYQGPWTRTGTNIQLTNATDNVGVGVLPSGTKFEVRGIDATPSNLVLRLTNSAATTLMTVNNVGDVVIPSLAGPGVVTTSSGGLLSIVSGSPVTGIGVANKVAFWNGTGTLNYNTNFHWDNTNNYLGIGTPAPTYPLTLGNTGGVFGVENTATFLAKNSTGIYENYLWPRWNDDVMYLNYGNAGFNIRNNASTSTMFMTSNGYVGIGVTPTATLSVAGTSGQVAHIGNVFSTAYAGITLNGTISDGSYNLLSSSKDPNLYINRATGYSIQFRENNGTQLTLNPAGDNVSRIAHAVLTSSNTWGTSLNIANTSSSGSTYSIVSTGTSHPMGAGSFVIQDGLSSNYAFVLNSLNADTHLSATTNSAACVGIGYANPATDLAGSQKLQVNGRICSSGFDICSDQRYKISVKIIPNALASIKKLRGVTYYWNLDDFPDRNFDKTEQIGVIAQEVEKLFPQIVSTDKAGYKAVDYSKLGPVLIEAVKELNDIVNQQSEKIKEMELQDKQQQKDIEQLRTQLNSIIHQLGIGNEAKAK